jgi:hypothetical protein
MCVGVYVYRCICVCSIVSSIVCSVYDIVYGIVYSIHLCLIAGAEHGGPSTQIGASVVAIGPCYACGVAP